MKKQTFNCTLLSDLVLKAGSATEGFQAALRYIPGAKFWGIAAARLYAAGDEVAEACNQLFYGGEVCFGDAFPLVGGEPALPVPFAWMKPKGQDMDGTQIYLSHRISDEFREMLVSKDIQLQQCRDGFFTEMGKRYYEPTHEFVLKSAYDRDNRRARDSQMFGYQALPAGTVWQFEVCADNEESLAQVGAALAGEHHIGRSRTAEFGWIKIAAVDNLPVAAVAPFVIAAGETQAIVFAKSNLCLINELGQNVLIPDAAMLSQWGFPADCKVLGSSRIRHRLYQSWNTRRNNRDADRAIVKAGSVFIIGLPTGHSGCTIRPIVGGYVGEGFGAVIVNPEFLTQGSPDLPFSLKKANADTAPLQEFAGSKDTQLIDALIRRQEALASLNSVDKAVSDFVSTHGSGPKGSAKFEKVSRSQWGAVRNMARGSASDDVLEKLLFLEIKNDKGEMERCGFLYKGIKESQWRNGRGVLYDYVFGKSKPKNLGNCNLRELVMKLASQMAKNANNDNHE